jgi:nucleoside-diphosphate-sugar epimerase
LSSLVIGTGFIGTAVTLGLRSRGLEATQSSRSAGRDVTIADGAALDNILANAAFEQIIVVGQLTRPDIDWVLDRVDGPRWLILSSQQLASGVPAPGTEVAIARESFALSRGACVIRPTMVYGRGQDKNITRLIKLLTRLRFALVPGSGDQEVQPVHVDDVIDLIASHRKNPIKGLYPVGGSEVFPMRELVVALAEVLGIRAPVIELPARWINRVAELGPLLGLRPDQLKRLTEPKTADWRPTSAAFRWEPAPDGIRLEQAVLEVRNSAML